MECPCPFCKDSIDPNNIDWVCPCCGTTNNHSSIAENCAYCRFAPRLFLCKECGGHYEGWLLLEDHDRDKPYVRIFRPNEYPVLTRTTYSIEELKVVARDSLLAEIAEKIQPQHMAKVLSGRFEFPYRARALVVHTFHENPAAVFWLHGWLLETETYQQDPKSVAGQLSVKIDQNRESNEPQIRVLDIRMLQ